MAITNRSFVVDASGTKAYGKVITPDTAAAYPLILFFPGQGEVGDGSVNTVDQLYAHGSPLALARDGKLSGWIVIGMQGVRSANGGNTIEAAQVGYMLVNDVLKNYNIDKTCVVPTGLSRGAEVVLELIGSSDYASLFTFAVAMSTPAINEPIVDWSKVAATVWLFHGTNDTGLTDYNNSVRYLAKLKNAHLTSVQGAGHDLPWAAYFDPAYTETFLEGTTSTRTNIYDAAKNKFSFTGKPVVSPTPQPTPVPIVTGNAKAVLTGAVNGRNVTLNTAGSSSGGSGFIDITKNGAYFHASFDGDKNDWGATTPATKTVLNLPDGSYVATLKINAKNGSTDTATFPFTIPSVAPAPDPNPVVGTGTANGQPVNLYKDGTWK